MGFYEELVKYSEIAHVSIDAMWKMTNRILVFFDQQIVWLLLWLLEDFLLLFPSAPVATRKISFSLFLCTRTYVLVRKRHSVPEFLAPCRRFLFHITYFFVKSINQTNPSRVYSKKLYDRQDG